MGTGRIALPVAEAGVRVDGIELSQDMVDRMREKPGGDQVEVTMGDMSQVTTGRTYGLVYLVFNTIGNLLTQDDQVRCFENAARHLTEDGVFVARVPGADRVRATGPPVHRRRAPRAGPRRAGRLPVRSGHPGPRREPRPARRRRRHASARSGCVWPLRPSSTSWPASPACGCATGGEGGTVSRSPPPAGATSASTSQPPPEHDATVHRGSLGQRGRRVGRQARLRGQSS